jgi:hypothetical protein
MQRTPVIWASLDPFVEGGPIIGRKVANAGFLEALLRADPFDQYHFFLQDEQGAGKLRTRLDSFPRQSKKVRFFPRTALPAQLHTTIYHVFHLNRRHPFFVLCPLWSGFCATRLERGHSPRLHCSDVPGGAGGSATDF